MLTRLLHNLVHGRDASPVSLESTLRGKAKHFDKKSQPCRAVACQAEAMRSQNLRRNHGQVVDAETCAGLAELDRVVQQAGADRESKQIITSAAKKVASCEQARGMGALGRGAMVEAKQHFQQAQTAAGSANQSFAGQVATDTERLLRYYQACSRDRGRVPDFTKQALSKEPGCVLRCYRPN